MGGEFSAGSVLVELKAQYQDLKRNVSAAKQEVSGFGAGVDATAKRVAASGQQISNSFDSIDRNSVKLAARVARLTGIMFAAQSVFTNFAGGEQGKASRGVAAASTGLSTFASVALAFPTPIGIALGAVAGLTAGIAHFVKTAEDGVTVADQLRAAMEAVAKKRHDFAVEAGFIGRTQTGTQRDLSLIALQRQQKEEVLRLAISSQQTQREKLDAGEITADEAQANIDRAEELIKKTRNQLRDLARSESVKDREALAEENKKLLDATAIELQAGLISPLEAAQAAASAARRELDALLKDPKVDPSALGLAIDKFKNKQGQVEAQRSLNELASGFSSAFGSAIQEGILSGKKPMAILADFGASLFGNFIQSAMKQLQEGLASVLASSGLGAAGAGAITGALGIGGAILSRLGNKSGQKFGSIKSAVTSSEATRGIIAGPANVAIAAVGENLSRAVEPMVAQQQIANELLRFIERNTRALRGGAAGAGGNVAIATDLG
jgi:hypothetical protein